MQLTYRGVNYEYNPLTVESAPGELGGKYRGASWRRSYPRHIPVPEISADLKYRGASYHIGSDRKVENAPRVQGKCGISQELTQTHLANLRSNLERRIQVAKAKGDETLLHLLEDEARQLLPSR